MMDDTNWYSQLVWSMIDGGGLRDTHKWSSTIQPNKENKNKNLGIQRKCDGQQGGCNYCW
jgi:hypothetical protein